VSADLRTDPTTLLWRLWEKLGSRVTLSKDTGCKGIHTVLRLRIQQVRRVGPDIVLARMVPQTQNTNQLSDPCRCGAEQLRRETCRVSRAAQ
jgi:hypothetical protein